MYTLTELIDIMDGIKECNDIFQLMLNICTH